MTDQTDTEELQTQTDEGGEGLPPADTGAPADAQADPFEDVAREHGWTPKEEWRGNPDDWRDPKGFIAYGMKRAREGADELKSLRTEVKSIGRVAEAINRRNVEEARREVEMRFAGAVENKDHEGARAAREELARLDQQETEPSGQEDVRGFVSRNSAWYGQNRAATALAQSVTATLARQGVSIPEQLRQAEEAVRQEMPQLFKPTPPHKQQAAVSAPNSRAANTTSRAKGFADLSSEAQRHGQDFLKRGMVKSLEDYARIYYEENA